MVEIKTSVGAFEAKTHFSNLLDRVEHGDRIVITRHGRAVAILSPVEIDKQSKDLVALGHKALACTEGVTLPKGMTIKDLINAGRKR